MKKISGFDIGWLVSNRQADPHKMYVLYSEAQARIEALEWLVEVQEYYISTESPHHRVSSCQGIEICASLKSALAECREGSK